MPGQTMETPITPAPATPSTRSQISPTSAYFLETSLSVLPAKVDNLTDTLYEFVADTSANIYYLRYLANLTLCTDPTEITGLQGRDAEDVTDSAPESKEAMLWRLLIGEAAEAARRRLAQGMKLKEDVAAIKEDIAGIRKSIATVQNTVDALLEEGLKKDGMGVQNDEERTEITDALAEVKAELEEMRKTVAKQGQGKSMILSVGEFVVLVVEALVFVYLVGVCIRSL